MSSINILGNKNRRQNIGEIDALILGLYSNWSVIKETYISDVLILIDKIKISI